MFYGDSAVCFTNTHLLRLEMTSTIAVGDFMNAHSSRFAKCEIEAVSAR